MAGGQEKPGRAHVLCSQPGPAGLGPTGGKQEGQEVVGSCYPENPAWPLLNRVSYSADCPTLSYSFLALLRQTLPGTINL